jgi:hypothetical protein
MVDFGDLRLPDRFWEKAEVVADASAHSGPCWIWVRHISKSGYGRIFWQGEARDAYRVSYETLVGAVPDGLELDHLCRNRACVNPAHLDAVPHRVNSLRGGSPLAAQSRQNECVHGHPLCGDNLIIRRDGSRRCRSCKNERAAERRARTKEQYNVYRREWRKRRSALAGVGGESDR